MRRPSLLPVLVTLAASGPLAARSQVFSPGELARPHAHLEGLASCTKCHVAGERLSGARCVECHVELRERLAARRGLHGRLRPEERACERCHREHLGRDFELVDWGEGGRRAFDHTRTGYPLRGKHRGAECARCHDPRLVEDPPVKALLAKSPRRRTFLGAPTACGSCHFDEHRGQLGADCQRCHGEQSWKPAGGFDHAKARYRLEGAHGRVACERCHPRAATPVAAAVAPLTPPRSPDGAVRYRGLAFAACLDCHRDPHQARFGSSCQSCHTVASWKRLTATGAERAFHEKTRYPLRGAHAGLACAACHGPAPKGKSAYRGLRFERCTDCHLDAHLGQLAGLGSGRAAAGASCDRCHGLERFAPALFEAEDHDRLEYRLEGAHRAVACARCHPQDPKLAKRLPGRRERARLERRGRAPKVSLALFDLPRASDCRTCHRDPHAGQLDRHLAREGCRACHGLDSFRNVRFDHARDSRFPLEGKHARVPCASCHRPGEGGTIAYRPLPVACAGCHRDPHAGQLARDGATDCARCHLAASWKDLRFEHARPFSAFALDGKHRKVTCDRCHPGVEAAPGILVRRYRPLPTTCRGCHADPHRGAFGGLTP